MSVKIIPSVKPQWPFEAYAHIIRPLTKDEGGGFLITFPDLPGCMSDGETIEEAIENGRDAFSSWVSTQADMGRPVPEPAWRPDEEIMPKVSGKFVQRVPLNLHARLVKRAKQEGVSLNTLVLTFIAEGIGRRPGKNNSI